MPVTIGEDRLLYQKIGNSLHLISVPSSTVLNAVREIGLPDIEPRAAQATVSVPQRVDANDTHAEVVSGDELVVDIESPDALVFETHGRSVLRFEPAGFDVAAEKTIAIHAKAPSVLSIEGAVQADPYPIHWGEIGDEMVLAAQFIAGKVVLSVVFVNSGDAE